MSLLRHRTFRHSSMVLLEFAAISVLILLFCAHILASDEGLVLGYLGSGYRLDAIEHERLSGILIPVELGLGLSSRAGSIGHLPTWNPYLGNGTPLINNGFFYLFNPFMSLPMLLMGAIQGGKLAIVLGLLMAGYNMWFLARALRLGRLARVTVAVLYALNGGLLAKLAAGHFQLGLSLVWPPLILAALLWTLRHRQRIWPVLMALAFALLFFSGNIYYSLHVMICCAAITAVYVLSRNAGRWQIDRAALARVLVGAVLAFGLTMIQFLPIWVTRDHVSHESTGFDDTTGALEETIDLSLNLNNFLLPLEAWSQLEDAPFDLLPQVHYSYIGPVVLLLIGAAAFLAARDNLIRQHKLVWLALGLAVFMMVWGAGQSSLLNFLYRHVPLLDEFRYLARANAIAALWWILLAGIGLDALWRWLRQIAAGDRARLLIALLVPVLLWGYYLLYSLSNNSTRLSLSLYNLNLFNTLDAQRFSSYAQASEVLFHWIVLALLIDTAIRLALHIRQRAVLLRLLGLRLLRAGLLLLALVAVFDVLHVNQGLFQFKVPEGNFGGLYAEALSFEAADQQRLPIIQEPHTPSTYDVYYSRVRSWGLHEGWIPLTQDGDIIPEASPKLHSLPRWAIVSTEFGRGAIYGLSLLFAENNHYTLTHCVARNLSGDDPCDLENEFASALYHLPTALPYAFVAAGTRLQAEADTINSETVRPATVLSHDIDMVLIQADAQSPREYLIVQEAYFPGWTAQIDGVEVAVQGVSYLVPGGNPGKFLAIPMEAGLHSYTLRFYPPGFNAGIILSGLSVVLMLLYLAGIRLPGRKPKSQ